MRKGSTGNRYRLTDAGRLSKSESMRRRNLINWKSEDYRDWQSAEVTGQRTKSAKWLAGCNRGGHKRCGSETFKSACSRGQLRFLDKLTNEQKRSRISKRCKSSARLSTKGMSSLEKLFQSLYPPAQFVGNRQFFVRFKRPWSYTGRCNKNPDFILPGTNKVVEVNGYYHKESPAQVQELIDLYAEVGYKCYVFWGSQLALLAA